MWDSLQKMVQVRPARSKRLSLLSLAKVHTQLPCRYLTEMSVAGAGHAAGWC